MGVFLFFIPFEMPNTPNKMKINCVREEKRKSYIILQINKFFISI